MPSEWMGATVVFKWDKSGGQGLGGGQGVLPWSCLRVWTQPCCLGFELPFPPQSETEGNWAKGTFMQGPSGLSPEIMDLFYPCPST